MPRHKNHYRSASCTPGIIRSNPKSRHVLKDTALSGNVPTKRMRVSLARENSRLRNRSIPAYTRVPSITKRSTSHYTVSGQKMELVKDVCEYLRSQLRLSLPPSFYNDWSIAPEHALIYLYVSCADRIEQPEEFAKEAAAGRPYRGFGYNAKAADAAEEKWKAKKFDTFVYRTVANRAAKITQRLLEYEDPAIVFVIAHEALHVHLREARIKIPYELEEALADWVGLRAVQGFSEFARRTEKHAFPPSDASSFIQRMEQYHAIIARALRRDTTPVTDVADLWTMVISAERKPVSGGPTIFLDRFDFPITNNAFLLRYRAYSEKYFLWTSAFPSSETAIESAFGNLQRWLGEFAVVPSNIENQILSRVSCSASEAVSIVSHSQKRVLAHILPSIAS